MARQALNCWHCGTTLEGVPLPLGRREECPHCGTSLHCCRMCEFYDPGAPKQCREPMADEVGDKEAPNFCDYFRPRRGLTAQADSAAADARARLAAVFGEAGSAGPKKGAPRADSPDDAEAEAARRKLDSLFGERDN